MLHEEATTYTIGGEGVSSSSKGVEKQLFQVL
jgi:hypothetical protein